VAVNRAMLALGHEVFDADGATFVRDRDLPDIWEANRVVAVTAASDPEVDRLLERVEREYAGFGHRRFDLDFTTPPALEARLALEGYHVRDLVVMVLAGAGRPVAAPADIRPCTGVEAWAAFEALVLENWRESARRHGLAAADEVGRQLARSHRRRSPPARYWLAWRDGRPCGYLSSWEGVDGVGQVEDLFVHAQARGHGIADALVGHGVADCRAAGAGPVTIVAEAADTPKGAYARMGFRPVALVREWLRRVTTSAART
jgi:ribosomal protein S18 acetylase RimI-like enzyme